MPKKQMKVAIQRLSETFSFKNMGASIKTKIGIVKLVTVALTIFTFPRPMHHKDMAMNSIAPLKICNGNRCVAKIPYPLIKTMGVKESVANKNLKKAISSGGKEVPKALIAASLALLTNRLRINQMIPIEVLFM